MTVTCQKILLMIQKHLFHIPKCETGSTHPFFIRKSSKQPGHDLDCQRGSRGCPRCPLQISGRIQGFADLGLLPQREKNGSPRLQWAVDLRFNLGLGCGSDPQFLRGSLGCRMALERFSSSMGFKMQRKNLKCLDACCSCIITDHIDL